jgi:hypothetical protein
MDARSQQPFTGGQMSLEVGRDIKFLTRLSNLVAALALGIVATLVTSVWILFT